MLLILIKLKEAYPDVIESFMKDEVSILQSPVLLPKERELLLRLLISYLPPSAVLSVIQNSSPSSSASIIYSLCHLPVDVLLEEYLSVESGLLNTDDSLVVDSIVDLLIAIARHASHFQRIQLIQILFKRMRKSKKNTAAFLQASPPSWRTPTISPPPPSRSCWFSSRRRRPCASPVCVCCRSAFSPP